jgi:NAD(P)H-hydrate epimerase
MIKIVSNEQMRLMDNYTINELKVPGLILMENAGRHAFDYITEFIKENKLSGIIQIFCGKGNNGGDGYVIARHLFNNGYKIKLFSVGDPNELKGDAKINYQICENYKIPVTILSSLENLSTFPVPSLIIDALLGTGIKGEVKGLFNDVIEYINHSEAAVISIDIPSGLNGDSPGVTGNAVSADLTITMALPKRAHMFYPARKKTGRLEIADIGIPPSVRNNSEIKINLVEDSDLSLPELEEDDHKYSAGKLFILAGSTGMTGAASLTANAALRTGVGLVNIGIPKSLNSILEVKVTEGLTIPLPETSHGSISKSALPSIKEKIHWADAVIIGPGCGREAETLSALIHSISYCIDQNKPLLIDADALFALSKDPNCILKLNANVILTPHHGEFLRLHPYSKSELHDHPWKCLQDFLSDKDFSINLKGAPSIVGNYRGDIYINSTGNPGLAKGGSGDVLAGIIGGLMARGVEPVSAAISGNYIHGEAADILVDVYGISSLLPSDLIDVLPDLM